jgi:hypothetical protein
VNAPATVSVLVALTKGPAAPTPTGQPSGGTQVTLTDSAGTVWPVQTLNGTETPTPWVASFPGIAAGAGSVSAQDVDSNGAAIAPEIEQGFDTEAPVVQTFLPTTGIVVTPVAPDTGGNTAAAAALKKG